MGRNASTRSSYTTLSLPLDVIEPHPDNDYSMDEDELAELVASIASDGLGQLPLVRQLGDGSYQMIAGHRRLEAYRRLAERDPLAYGELPVTLVEGLNDSQATVLLNVTNLVARRLSQEERGARYAAIGREVPALRAADPSLKGVRTNDIIARIVTEETGQAVSAATVKRAIAAERRMREAREQAEKLTGELDENWRTEASTGLIDPLTLKEISELPAPRQSDLFVQYQRDELTPAQLKARIRELRPKTQDDARRALQTAVKCVEDVQVMARDNVPIPQGLVHKLRSLIDQL
ncbi:ParB/RepB/Spo0J family partition protein [Gordonibacter massiliensis (ex Traore et al. 2017)]|uniref:ParB/RepB/Spo0J family partition protein n=1 Tax=Gordonibacter massiliensis (ex Traore et al. 2017) TaxID=1841863 RepID=UPI001C8B9555|nr:ParB/RepB/Spo0J family partition protein [Gordonibacter massiliensis (ex Traore et al. 2017)]MBX9032549.1 ParB N-terminal domain-containing protein [Gordonibacter massiliensis (ex Traore et al. 2017)]